jgi:hypothetical protein
MTQVAKCEAHPPSILLLAHLARSDLGRMAGHLSEETKPALREVYLEDVLLLPSSCQPPGQVR